jgi:GNAT superfamily N-acetyltransferase
MSTPALRRTFLTVDGTFLVVAIDEDANVLAGHAFARRFPVTEGLRGNALWITQLVVESTYRNRGIGAHLISTALDSRDVCVGLVTSHPYAVRALEKACRRAVSIEFAAFYGQYILDSSGVTYLGGRTAVVADGCCKINTGFFVDHTEVNTILAGLIEKPISGWCLGTIEDGEEFLAVVDLR